MLYAVALAGTFWGFSVFCRRQTVSPKSWIWGRKLRISNCFPESQKKEKVSLSGWHWLNLCASVRMPAVRQNSAAWRWSRHIQPDEFYTPARMPDSLLVTRTPGGNMRLAAVCVRIKSKSCQTLACIWKPAFRHVYKFIR